VSGTESLGCGRFGGDPPEVIGSAWIWRCTMKAYEYYAEVLPDGHLSVPEDIRKRLKKDSKVRVMLLLEDDDAAWDEFTMSQFMAGYSEKDSIYDSL
jgi:hypothetical protein